MILLLLVAVLFSIAIFAAVFLLILGKFLNKRSHGRRFEDGDRFRGDDFD